MSGDIPPVSGVHEVAVEPSPRVPTRTYLLTLVRRGPTHVCPWRRSELRSSLSLRPIEVNVVHYTKPKHRGWV